MTISGGSHEADAPRAATPSSGPATGVVFREAKFKIGDVVKHRVFPFRGVVFDVDPVFDNTEEWLAAIPEDVRPHRDQPFYHLLAENAETTYVAYVSEQNLLPDDTGRPCRHPLLREMFSSPKKGVYRMKALKAN
ncbi:MAG TPA: heat shock protein HspQ [Candidatus Binatia bacterium]|nr:heat shock protein HspQ [Candidatus Binatia bacterium]